MDELFQRAEVDWIPLVIFVLWALTGLFGNKKRKQRREEEAGDIPPPRQRTEQVERGGANTELQEVLREIERDLGLSPASKTPEKPQPRAELPRGPWHAAPSPTKAGEQRSRALHRRGAMHSSFHEHHHNGYGSYQYYLRFSEAPEAVWPPFPPRASAESPRP